MSSRMLIATSVIAVTRRAAERARDRFTVAARRSARARAVDASTAPARPGAQIAVRPVARRRRARRASRSTTRASAPPSGRVFYYPDQVDFAVSEIPFQTAYRDATGTVIDRRGHARGSTGRTCTCRSSPVVRRSCTTSTSTASGSPSFDSQPDTLAKIFTGVIKTWNDPAIVADNPARHAAGTRDHAGDPLRRLGHVGAVHGVHGEPDARRSGTPSAARSGITLNPCPATSLYPEFPGSVAQQLLRRRGRLRGRAVQQRRDHATWSTATRSSAGFPVASMLNKAGYYTQPTAHDVAIALQGAHDQPRPHAGPRGRVQLQPTRVRTRCRATAT